MVSVYETNRFAEPVFIRHVGEGKRDLPGNQIKGQMRKREAHETRRLIIEEVLDLPDVADVVQVVHTTILPPIAAAQRILAG